jgi:hypothetical protein
VATIQIILQAINNASSAFDDVAAAAEKLAAAEELAAKGFRSLSEAELAAAQAAVDTIEAYTRLRDEFGADAAAAALAGEAVGVLAERMSSSGVVAVAAADGFRMLTDSELAAAAAAMEFTPVTAAAAEAAIKAGLDAVMASQGIRALTEAELDSINTTLAWREALAAAAEEEAAVAARSLGVAAAVTVMNARLAGAGTAARNAAFGWNLWGAALARVNQQIPLWGGLLDGLLPKFLTQISALHLWSDALLEIVAVWVPAIAAVAAWAAAASDAFNDIVRQMTNMHTVSDATGQSFGALTGNLEALHDAVRPQVWQIFGDGLTVVTKKGGDLNAVIMQTGQVLDQLAARAAVALQSSSANTFLANAVTDVRLLGAAFGNLFGIIGNLIRMNQAWATSLLQAGTSILGLIERVTSLIIPLGQLLVLGHGFVLWVGLAVTAVLAFGGAIAGWGTRIIGAVTGFAGLIRAMYQYIQVYGIMDALSLVNPMAWIAIAVGAIAGLVAWLSTAKSAVQEYGDAVMKTAENASTLTGAIAELQSGVAQSAGMAATATAAATAANDKYATSVVSGKQALEANAVAANRATAAAQEATGVHQQLSGELGTVNTRLTSLAGTYGSTSNALGLLNTAGVTNTQMLDQSSGAWAIIQQQVAATYAAYKQMGNQAGILGNDLAVLNKQATDQYQAIQKLNQAWDTQTAAVTGTQSSFDTVAQGFQTLDSSSVKFTTSLAKLTVSGIQFVKSGIDQLTTSGVALNQAFSQQVGNVNSLADSWRSAGLSQNLLVQGLAAGIAPLEQYAAGSQEATAQLVNLAEEAGYQGPASLTALNKFLGITSTQLKNTSGDMQTMKNIADQATIQEALLTGAMQAQGSYITGQLIGDINAAILAYNGVSRAATAYGTAVAQYGRDSTQAKTAADILTQSIIKSGEAANQSTGQIAAMISKVLGIPAKVALQIVMDGIGSYTLNQVSSGKLPPAASGVVNPNVFTQPAAAGWYVSGGTPGRDSVPILAMPGELVVPTRMVSGGAVDHLRGRIPGFAAGGVVGTGNLAVLTGQQAVADYASFSGSFTTAMVTAMRRGMKSKLYDEGGVLPPGVSVAWNQSGANELVLPSGVIQGFTTGMQQLHGPLASLTPSLSSLATAVGALTAATTAATAASKTTAATAAAKPNTPATAASAAQTIVTAAQARLAADKANTAMLASHLTEVKQAIKDTPKTDKTQQAALDKLEKTLDAALKKAQAAQAAEQKTLTADIKKSNQDTAAAMRAQIASITKLLNSGTSSTSASGLWTQLSADEKTLAAALDALKSGTSGGSSSAAAASKTTAAATTSSAATLTSIKNQIYAEYALLDKTAKGSAASAAIWTKLDALYAKEDALTKTTSTAKTAAGSSSSGSVSTGAAYSVVVDRKAESDLDAILAQARADSTTLKQILACLGRIEAEDAPAAQAKAIGPAVASALNSVAGAAAGTGGRSTRRG